MPIINWEVEEMPKVVTAFKRYEKKYLLTEKQYNNLIKVLKTKMKADHHGQHTICNLYFDTDDYQMIRNSIEKPIYKEKIRIRSYGTPKKEDTVFIELKKKYAGIVYKRRVSMTLQQAEQYIEGGIIPLEVQSSQIMQEIDYMMQFYRPKIKVYIGYNRLAMFGIEDRDLRITFDSNIKWRDNNLSLDEGAWGKPMLKKNQILMEIKTAKAMPLWLTEALTKGGIMPNSFSKYGVCYQEQIAPKLKKKWIAIEKNTWKGEMINEAR